MARKTSAWKLGKSYAARFSPDGRQLVTLGRDVALWDVASRKKAATAHPFANPSWVDWSPGGAAIVVKSTTGEMAALAVPSLEFLATLCDESWGEGCGPVFGPDGAAIADGSKRDGTLTVRDAMTGATLLAEEHAGQMVHSLAASADRGRFAYALWATVKADVPWRFRLMARRWPFAANPARCLHEEAAPERLCWAIALDPPGDRLAAWISVGGQPRLLEVRAVDSGELLATRDATGRSGNALAWSPDGTRLACVEDGRVAVYDATTLEELGHAEMKFPCAVEFSPDGTKLAMGAWSDGRVEDVATLCGG